LISYLDVYFASLEVLSVMVIAVIIHELGHFFTLKKLGYDPNPMIKGINPCITYKSVNDKDKNKVIVAGILPGLVVVLIALSYSLVHVFTVVLYLYGCNADFKKLRR
jgi:hypothetical protein